MEEKAPGLGRCPANGAATGWALSALQTAAGDSRITHQNQQASGQAGISSSRQRLPVPPSYGEHRLNISGWLRVSEIWGQRRAPQKSELGQPWKSYSPHSRGTEKTI